MSYWGLNIFQPDHTCDLIIEIESDVGDQRVPFYFFCNGGDETVAKEAWKNGCSPHSSPSTSPTPENLRADVIIRSFSLSLWPSKERRHPKRRVAS